MTDTNDNQDPSRRDFLYITTAVFGATGAAGVAWPLIDQMTPDASMRALASVEIDLDAVEVGQSLTITWRGKPVFIRRRTQEEIRDAENVSLDALPDPEADKTRAVNPEWLVMVGVCTHLGCVPLGQAGEFNGWFCPCHGSHYDTSGRIRKGPAPKNLEIPPYQFVSDSRIKIG